MVPVPAVDDPTVVLNQQRFTAVFAEVYEPVQRYVRRRCAPGDVDDVVSEVLTVVWRRLDQVPVDGAIPWTYGVARRCLANHRRGDARRTRLVDRLRRDRVEPAEPTAVDDPDLAAALARLTSDDREVLHLWAWEQLAPREIAVVLDITPNAAAIRVHRAKARLAEQMGRQDLVPSGHDEGGSNTEVSR